MFATGRAPISPFFCSDNFTRPGKQSGVLVRAPLSAQVIHGRAGLSDVVNNTFRLRGNVLGASRPLLIL